VKRLIVVLALSACTQSGQMAAPAPPTPQAPAAGSLSDGASKIVAALRLRPDIDRLCGDGEAFRDAMREVVINLVMSGEIGGNRRRISSTRIVDSRKRRLRARLGRTFRPVHGRREAPLRT
jgi:hypothetical protein